MYPAACQNKVRLPVASLREIVITKCYTDNNTIFFHKKVNLIFNVYNILCSLSNQQMYSKKWHDNLIKLSVCLKPTERRIVDKKKVTVTLTRWRPLQIVSVTDIIKIFVSQNTKGLCKPVWKTLEKVSLFCYLHNTEKIFLCCKKIV